MTRWYRRGPTDNRVERRHAAPLARSWKQLAVEGADRRRVASPRCGSRRSCWNGLDGPPDSLPDDCVQNVINLLNGLDLSAIDPADGIDDSEAAAFDAALGDDEDLVVGLLNRMSDAQIDRVLADADPRATAVLGRPAESDDFTTVGNSL